MINQEQVKVSENGEGLVERMDDESDDCLRFFS